MEKRDIFDHFSIWLKSSDLNWSHKPFKFNNCWFGHNDFLKFVKDEWNSFEILGRHAFVIKENHLVASILKISVIYCSIINDTCHIFFNLFFPLRCVILANQNLNPITLKKSKGIKN